MRPRENQRNWFKRYDAAHAFGENLPEHGRTAQARRDRLHHLDLSLTHSRRPANLYGC
jgi:hypothetical protein